MTDWESCKAVERHPGKLGGVWVGERPALTINGDHYRRH